MGTNIAPAWDNKIVEYDPAVPLDQLLASPRNPKIHPRAQTDALKGILGEVGWLTGLICNIQTQHILDGHDRIKAAMEAGQATAPVFYVNVPEAMEPYILSTFDPVGSLAATDSAILDELLREVSSADSAVQALLDRIAGEPVDPAELWAGMPEFEQDDASDKYKSLTVHFETAEDYEAFAQLVNQPLTERSNFIWYPYKPTHGVPRSMQGYEVRSES